MLQNFFSQRALKGKLETLQGRSKGTWALGHSKGARTLGHLGTWALKQLNTWALEGHLGTHEILH